MNDDDYSYNINLPVVTIPPKHLAGIVLAGLASWCVIGGIVWLVLR